LSKFLDDQSRTNGEIYEFTLKQSFLPKHSNEIFYNWQRNGLLDVKLANGENARKKAFYISYKYYKSDGSKVSFSKK